MDLNSKQFDKNIIQIQCSVMKGLFSFSCTSRSLVSSTCVYKSVNEVNKFIFNKIKIGTCIINKVKWLIKLFLAKQLKLFTAFAKIRIMSTNVYSQFHRPSALFQVSFGTQVTGTYIT